MAVHETPNQMLERHRRTMGEELGPIFHRLWNDAAQLHLKWNEFVVLFATSPAQLRVLNSVAPAFFNNVFELSYEDFLLSLMRIADSDHQTLSVHTLARHVRVAIRDEVNAAKVKFVDAAAFAEDARNNLIAHRNLDVALGRAPRPTYGSRNEIRGAIRALDDVIHIVERHYYKTAPTMWDFLEPLGGTRTLVSMLERGLRDRDREIGHHRHPSPPDEAAE